MNRISTNAFSTLCVLTVLALGTTAHAGNLGEPFDNGMRASSGIVWLAQDQRLETCVSHAFSEHSTEMVMVYFNANDPLNPLMSENHTLLPGEGKCFDLHGADMRGEPLLAVMYFDVETDGEMPALGLRIMGPDPQPIALLLPAVQAAREAARRTKR